MKIIAVSQAGFEFVRSHHKGLNEPRLNMSCQAYFSEFMNTLFVVDKEVEFWTFTKEIESLHQLMTETTMRV